MENWLSYRQNNVFDMRFSNIFEKVFPRIRLSNCYHVQNTKSKIQAA